MSYHEESKHVSGDLSPAEMTEKMLRRKIEKLKREKQELLEALQSILRQEKALQKAHEVALDVLHTIEREHNHDE